MVILPCSIIQCTLITVGAWAVERESVSGVMRWETASHFYSSLKLELQVKGDLFEITDFFSVTLKGERAGVYWIRVLEK